MNLQMANLVSQIILSSILSMLLILAIIINGQQAGNSFSIAGFPLSSQHQQQQQQSKQYAFRSQSIASNYQLVNDQPSLPPSNTQQQRNSLQQQQSAQLENVIESTPPSMTASLISVKTTNNHNHHNHHHSHHSNNNNNNNINNHNHQPQHAPLISVAPLSQTLGAGLVPSNIPTCQLPQTWAGRWYQANKEPIRVTNTEISDKGICRDQKGDKFLFEYNGLNNNNLQKSSNNQPCLMCLVINERHLNVLQYKESSCQPLPANYHNRTSNNIIQSSSSPDDDHSLLDSICSDITGDAQLESLFRLDTPSIECPISGQYSLSYDNCRDPPSSLDSCIDKNQLNFKYSACTDVPGSESKYEVLKCYADWSEGNNYYMIGRLDHASNPLDKGKFRCFVYERSPDGRHIQMGSSLEESCYGLINPYEAPKTLRLTTRPPTNTNQNNKCNFPSYILSQSENWLSVDNSLVYMFNQNSSKFQVKETKEGNVIEEATCLQQFNYYSQQQQSNLHPHQLNQFKQPQLTRSPINQPRQAINRRHSSTSFNHQNSDQQQQVKGTSDTTVYLIQITKNCHTTNYCVRFYKRSNGIVQIDYFMHSPGDTQCRSAFVESAQTQIITSTNLAHQPCPFEGVYTIEASIESDLSYNPSNIFVCPRQSLVTSQCESPSKMKIISKCVLGRFSNKNLHCLGSWTVNNLVRLILVDDERQRYSAWYRDWSGSSDQQQQASAAISSDNNNDDSTEKNLHMPATNTNSNININPISALATPIIDLQIALITPLPVVTKLTQVRLTRRNHCSDLAISQTQTQTWPNAHNNHLNTISPAAPSLGFASPSSSSSQLFHAGSYPTSSYHPVPHAPSNSIQHQPMASGSASSATSLLSSSSSNNSPLYWTVYWTTTLMAMLLSTGLTITIRQPWS